MKTVMFYFKVEVLLSSYLKDVGISEEQFVEACSAPSIQNRHQMQVNAKMNIFALDSIPCFIHLVNVQSHFSSVSFVNTGN